MLTNVLWATTLADGTIVLRNSLRGLFEIRYYDATEHYLSTASRFGQGPYEFHFPLGVYRLSGDSIFVAGEDDRFAVFGPRGERVREGRLGLGSALSGSLSLGFDSWRLALATYRGPSMPPPGTRRSVSTLFVYDLLGSSVDSVAVVRARTTLIQGYRAGISSPAVTITSPFPSRSISRRDRSRAKDAYSSLFSGDTQKRWARYARTMNFPDHMPWFGRLKVDVAGNLWVQDYEPFWTEGPQHWAVYAPSGRLVADVSVPPEALPTCARRPAFPCNPHDGFYEIGGDYVLVPQSDELGVRYLRKFELHKPQS